MIHEFKSFIPEVEQINSKIKDRRDTDPILMQMVKDLSEAVDSMSVSKSLDSVKKDFLKQSIEHVINSRPGHV
jgi:hypothetical protein